MATRTGSELNWGSWFLRRFLSFFLLALFCSRVKARTTDPEEVRALNSLFFKWNISSTMSEKAWNITGDPCSGVALTGYIPNPDYEDTIGNPAILCDCSFNNGSTCHITTLIASHQNIMGNIPEEVQSFKYLIKLSLIDNFLIGPFPSFIGNFSKMKWLSVSNNLLSGPIPKELGNLQNLIALGLGSNNFSGSLPEELGNMTSLEKLYDKIIL